MYNGSRLDKDASMHTHAQTHQIPYGRNLCIWTYHLYTFLFPFSYQIPLAKLSIWRWTCNDNYVRVSLCNNIIRSYNRKQRQYSDSNNNKTDEDVYDNVDCYTLRRRINKWKCKFVLCNCYRIFGCWRRQTTQASSSFIVHRIRCIECGWVWVGEAMAITL